MERQRLDATALKVLRTEDPDLYRAELARIEGRALGAQAQPPAPMYRRSVDVLLDHMRRAYNLDETEVAQLAMVRRNTIYACVKLRSEMLAALPLLAFRTVKGAARGRRDVGDRMRGSFREWDRRVAKPFQMRTHEEVEEVSHHDLLTLLERPNPDWTGLDLMRMTIMYGDLAGQAHWLLERGESGTGKPSELSVIKPSRMTPIKAEADDNFRTLAGWWKDQYKADAEKLVPGEVVWFRHPDPEDPDYGALSPADVARLGADSYHQAMTANRNVFARGLTADGMIVPPEEGDVLGWQQSDELERDVNLKMRGKKNSHAVPVMPFRFDFVPFDNMSPHDAEFIALMEFAIEDTARVYGVPIEMIGGTRRTFSSTQESDPNFWGRTMEPLACWYASVITHQLVPMFSGIDYVAFDLSGVSALQEDETARWARGKEQVASIMPILASVATGQVTPAQAEAVIALALDVDAEDAKVIVGDGPAVQDIATDKAEEPRSLACAVCGGGVADLPDDAAQAWCSAECFGAWCLAHPDERSVPVGVGRGYFVRAASMARGSEEHARYWGRAVDAMAPHEKRIAGVATKLLERQAVSIRTQLDSAKTLDLAALASMFQRARWVKEFRGAIEPELAKVAQSGADVVTKDIGRSARFDPNNKAAVNWLRKRAQRFAQEVNDTTWQRLKGSLAAGLGAGDAMPALAERVIGALAVTEGRAATIARTEVVSAYNMGGLLTVQELAADSGLDLEKEWVSSLDDRVRDDHVDAHGQTVGLDEDFEVGGDTGPGPGEMGSAENDVNCRCVLKYGRAGRAARARTFVNADMAGAQHG